MISLLTDSLRRASIEFTIKELDDILWLGSLLDAKPRPKNGTTVPEMASSENGEAFQGTPENNDEREEPPDQHPQQQERPHPIYAPEVVGSLRGGILRMPGVAGTRAPSQFKRALQPFARRIASRHETKLDEDATAACAADSGIWIPVFRPIQERCFDLSLVIEDCTSAELRSAALTDLTHIFRNYSGLRSVMRYHLTGHGKLRLTSDGGADLEVERLLHNDARHLVLFATDGTSSRWHDGSAQAFIHALGDTTSVSILHLLPESAWDNTLIGKADLALHFARAGEPNRRAHIVAPWWIDAHEARTSLPVPVISLEPASAGVWAQAISARGGTITPGVMVAPLAEPATPSTQPAHAVDPAELVARYRQMVSPAAYELAIFLSPVDPLTVPVMRVVQRSMSPNSGDGELAEFILGGLVKLCPDTGPTLGSGAEKIYRFREGVRTQLAKALRISEDQQIRGQLRMVGRFLESGANTAASFTASFPAPDGEARLSEWALPFAAVSRQMLSGFADAVDNADGDLPLPSEVVQQGENRRTLRILHLANLHIQEAYAAVSSSARPELGNPWHEKLSSIAAGGVVDLVCVSGDLTWAGKQAEFEAARTFLDGTLLTLGLGSDRLYVVPGNHDLLHLDSTVPLQLEENFDSNPKLNPKWEQAQENYRAWIGRYLPHMSTSRNSLFADYQVTLKGWMAPLRIVGFDNSWMSAVTNTLALAESQLRMLNTLDRTGLLITIMHHAPDAQIKQEHVKRSLKDAGVKLLLSGHSHFERRSSVNGGMVESAVWGLSAGSGGLPMEMHVIDCDLGNPDACEVQKLTPVIWSQKHHAWTSEPVQYVGSSAETALAESQPRHESPPQKRFFGRDKELSELLSKMTEMRVPRCIIMGARGSGKTVLASKFGAEHWSPFRNSKAPCAHFSVPDGSVDSGHLAAALLSSLGSRHKYSDAATYLRTTGTLLIVDDVNNASRLEAARMLIRQLDGCSIMLIARPWNDTDLFSAANELTMATLQLEGLHLNTAMELLHSEATTTEASAIELEQIVEALHGNPDALCQAAAFLKKPDSTAWLMTMLCGQGNYRSAVLSGEHRSNLEELERLAFPICELRQFEWARVTSNMPLLQYSPNLLAHGPIVGGPPSLGATITNLSTRPLSGEVDATFNQFCDFAERLLGLQRHHDAIRFTPIMSLWLRAREPKQRSLALVRFDQWITSHLNNEGAWLELNSAQAALVDWLENCPLSAAKQVRDTCVGYALRHGPLTEWRLFCERIHKQSKLGEQNRIHWRWNSAQLSDAAGHWDVALLEIDGVLVEFHEYGIDNAITRAAYRLKDKILQLHPYHRENSKLPPLQKLEAQAAPVRIVPAPGHHQQRIANAAIAATERAFNGNLRAGIVVQSLGTGMTMSLMAYLAGCRERPRLEHLTFIILVDRLGLVQQVVHQYRDWCHERKGPPVIVPETIDMLRIQLLKEQSGVIVTTVQKFQHVHTPIDRKCVVVCFGLKRPSSEYMQTLNHGTLIFFSHESNMLKPSRDDGMGEIIISYPMHEAIKDGYLTNVKIRRINFSQHSAVDQRNARSDPKMLDNMAKLILSELEKHRDDRPLKAILIVDNNRSTQTIFKLFCMKENSNQLKIMQITASESRLQKIIEFNRITDHAALLITTPGIMSELHLVGVHICYVFSDLSAAAMFKLTSFINRPVPGKSKGEITDFANNDWHALREDQTK